MPKPKTQHNKWRKVYWTGALTVVAAVVVWLTTVASNVTSIASNVLKMRQEPTAMASAQAPGNKPAPPEKLHATRRSPTSPSTFQLSTGNQSPNLKNVHGSLRIQYQSAPAVGDSSTPVSAHLPAADGLGKTSGSVQISTGAQSPNISVVDHDVQMNYTTPGDPTIKN